MDFNELFKSNKSQTSEFTVEAQDTADFIGNTGIMMLSTPSMIKFMEITAAQIVFDKLPENYRLVGTKVDIKHINPTPVDSKIKVKAILTSIDGSKLSYDVEAFNDKCKIGFGTYEQHIIEVDKFLNGNA